MIVCGWIIIVASTSPVAGSGSRFSLRLEACAVCDLPHQEAPVHINDQDHPPLKLLPAAKDPPEKSLAAYHPCRDTA
jgi:hypothetical protein